MPDHSIRLTGRRVTSPPPFFMGAVANLFVPPVEKRVLRLAKKVEAGARFIQTQYCFDVDVLKAYMRQVWDLGLHISVRACGLPHDTARQYVCAAPHRFRLPFSPPFIGSELASGGAQAPG